MRSGRSAPVTLNSVSVHPESDSNTWFCARQSSKSSADTPDCHPFLLSIFHKTVNCSGWGYDTDYTIHCCTMLKSKLVDPTPIARVRTATTIKPGLFRKLRVPYRKSCFR